MSFEVYELVNILGFILGLALGAVGQKNQFCFSGSIKDYILTKSTKRGASVIMAMIIAVISTALVANNFQIDLTESNYYRENINYFSIVLGGLIFGVGMMLADGCSNRHLIKFAQGDIHSLIVIVFTGIFAFATAKGFINGFFAPITTNETLLEWSSLIGNITMNIYFVVGVLVILLAVLVRKLNRVISLWDGVLVGLFVAAAWYITGVIGADSIERVVDLEALSFVYPTGRAIELFMYYDAFNLVFPICLVLGVIIGAFLMSKINRRYSFGCTASKGQKKVRYNMIGGALMGTGGVLSIGCTVGQGLSGLSTLAFASFLAIVSIFISATITAILLNKKDELPMCFIFEWKDNRADYQI
ncbi:YeeE/YedE family protein [Halarcobacter bivalviorum]|uniref:YeeE/YedE family protein n=1 Tax=Halarcobacter bivalviorum TaxID=663364 RepID=UPI00100ACBD1|nr:YeeE/YedE family protein [Halarcobacter bivalviorum]RXK07293.1 hypothetical protein CRU97_04070 [Halarcobacter bivalviorum]